MFLAAAPSSAPEREALNIVVSRGVKEYVSFVRYFWLLFASWNPSTGLFETGRFCVFPTEADNINVMDFNKVCSKDIDEGVERIRRPNI